MAMSLEDLLAEEGFKRRKAKLTARTSFVSERQNTKREANSLLAVRKTERTISDLPRYLSKREFSTSISLTAGKPRVNSVIPKEKTKIEFQKATSLKSERRIRQDSWDANRFRIGSSDDLHTDEIAEVGPSGPYKDVYLNKAYAHEGNKGKNIMMDRRNRNNSLKLPDSSYKKSNMIIENNNISDESESKRQTKIEESFVIPALDEAAIKAIISILSDHVKHFLKDEEFRISLRHNSFASLNFVGLDEGLNTESKVIENLERAIAVAERAVEENATLKELKRASLQLSVITGINSNDLKGGFTSGVPNFKLSACAHLYLSVIYMLQKKDVIAAKYLLQVFYHSPFQARSMLLPDLWEHLFLPHLLHLKLWYDNESCSLSDSPFIESQKLLDKIYNESLDSGTYQFALYYKDWLADGVEAPSVPLIKIPSFSAQLMPKRGLHGHSSSPATHFSPRSMVSKKLYDEVFRCSHYEGAKLEVDEEDNFVSARSFNSPAPEYKQLILYSHESLVCTNSEPDGESLPDDLHVIKEEQGLHLDASSRELDIDGEYRYCEWQQENLQSSRSFQARSPEKEIRQRLLHETPETSMLKLQQNEQHSLLSQPEDSEYPMILMQQTRPQFRRESRSRKVRPLQEHRENEDLCRRPSLFNIPKDYLCPLTGLLFEDPVTLETGQTIERESITNWFEEGSLTCPVTGKALQCQSVPDTNLILKHVIDHWKTEHYQTLLALVSRESEDTAILSTLEQLQVVLSKEDRIINVKRILSLGGLHFLLRRFHCGITEEKTFILPLLCCCIEADAGCRNDVTRSINKSNLLELLHSEQVTSRRNAVLLLTELISLNRRNNAKKFIEGIDKEIIINAMDDLIMYLENCPLEEIPLVGALLLHLDLLSGLCIGGIYRHEAVDALTISLERSLSDENVQKKCSRALLVLGGYFSLSGKLMTEDWILKLSGFVNGPDWDSVEYEANVIAVDSNVKNVGYRAEEFNEEKARETWLVSISASLIGDGKKSFLETISKCLCLGDSDLVRVCLTTVAWLSSSLSEAEFQLYALSALISPLKNCLDYGGLVEHRILASLCILNFSRVPECRVLLMNIAEEISYSLENLEEVTWTAKELRAIIPGGPYLPFRKDSKQLK